MCAPAPRGWRISALPVRGLAADPHRNLHRGSAGTGAIRRSCGRAVAEARGGGPQPVSR